MVFLVADERETCRWREKKKANGVDVLFSITDTIGSLLLFDRRVFPCFTGTTNEEDLSLAHLSRCV